MKYLRLFLPLPLIAALAACGGGKGSPAPAPARFTVVPQDTQLYMTWDAVPGVAYQVFCDPNKDTIDSHGSHDVRIYSGFIYSGTYYATGLVNGTRYACTVNGRTGDGAGGPDAPYIVKTPGYAGAAWSAGNTTALSGMTVRSVAVGLPTGLGLTSDQFVAVGSSGKLAVSAALTADATLSWGTPAQVANATLNAVSFYAPGNRFVAVGDDGRGVYSTTSGWTAVTMAPAGVSMNAVTSSGSPLIAVGGDGAAGVIYASTDSAASWSPVSVSGISANVLRSVVYVPDTVSYWIAVGDGVILRSTDGANWVNITPTNGTTTNYRSVAMLPVTDSTNTVISYRVAVVAADGTVRISTDGTSWTDPSTISGTDLVAVYAAKGQFMAIDSAGNAYTSNQTANNWGWSSAVATGVDSSSSPPVTVVRYTPNFPSVSNGWMVFDAGGKQFIAK